MTKNNIITVGPTDFYCEHNSPTCVHDCDRGYIPFHHACACHVRDRARVLQENKCVRYIFYGTSSESSPSEGGKCSACTKTRKQSNPIQAKRLLIVEITYTHRDRDPL